jgi:hypothetical protein
VLSLLRRRMFSASRRALPRRKSANSTKSGPTVRSLEDIVLAQVSANCTTTVTWTSDGRTQSVTQTGTASGDCNIASAEVCSSFDGGFETC